MSAVRSLEFLRLTAFTHLLQTMIMPASVEIAIEERELLREREGARLTELRPQIVAICESYGVAKLSVFGSLLHAGEFGPGSDFDFLVEFLPGAKYGLLELAGIALDLEDLLGCKVDLGTPSSLSRYIRDEVVAEAEVFYAAP